MKKFLFIILALAVIISLSACGKKERSLTDMEEPISIEELSKVDSQDILPETAIEAEPMATPAPALPIKPTAEQIQTALKNAGYYTGLIDGKKGSLTLKAIEDFQKANNLQVDGKVGPKTWAVLGPYLNPQAASGKKR